jgi:hypothetical protein
MTHPPRIREQYSIELFNAVVAALPEWVERRIRETSMELAGTVTDEVRVAARVAARAVCQEVGDQLTELLAEDVDAQRQNPLHVIRGCMTPATKVLRDAAVPPRHRDEFERNAMPDDVYSLGPIAWIDLGDVVHEAGINWGAWKAATIISRRRAEGKTA